MTQADQLAKALEDLLKSAERANEIMLHEAGIGVCDLNSITQARQTLAAYRAQASTTGAATTGAAVLPEQAVVYADPSDLAKDGNWDTFIVKHASEWHEGLRFKVPLYASPPQVAEPLTLTDWQVKELAHRGAFLFKQAPDPSRSDTYTFNEYCLLDFARAILHAATLQQEKQG